MGVFSKFGTKLDILLFNLFFDFLHEKNRGMSLYVLYVGFECNITLPYDTGMIRVSYGQSIIQSYGTNT